MAVEKTVDINVNVKGAGAAKSKLGGVSSATGKLEGQSQGLVGNLLNMSGGLKGVAGAAGVALGAMAALKIVQQVAEWFKIATQAAIDFTKSSIKMADSFDVMEKRLKALTGSAEEAALAMTQIKDFAAGTTAQVDELTEAYIAMQPVFGSVSDELMMDVANAAAGAGRSIQTIADTFIRLKTGDFGVEQLRKLNIVKTDLEEFDVEFDKTGKLVSSTEVAMEGVSALIQERYGNMQEEMATTLTGALSNLEDMWMQLKDSVGKELLPILNELVRAVTDFVEKGMKAGDIKALFKELATILKDNKEEIIGLIEGVIQLGVVVIGAVGSTIKLANKMQAVAIAINIINNAMTVMKYILADLIWLAEKYWEIQTFGIHKARTMQEILGEGSGFKQAEGTVTKTAGGPVAKAKRALDAGKPAAEVKAAALAEGVTEAQWQDYYGRYRAGKEGAPPPGLDGKPVEVPTADVSVGRESIEDRREAELQRDRDVIEAEFDARIAMNQKLRDEKEKADKEAAAKKLALLEHIAKTVDPTQYIIEGLKSGDMNKAMKDWAIQLGDYAATELLKAIVMAGFLAILNMITGGATSIIPKGQHGMYTGGYEGPVFVHKDEIIMPLDNIGAMTKLINRTMMGANLPTPADASGGGATVLNVDPKASDLVDIYRAESVNRGDINLDILEGVPY